MSSDSYYLLRSSALLLIDSTPVVQITERCLAKCSVGSGIKAHLVGLLLTSVTSACTLLPFIP